MSSKIKEITDYLVSEKSDTTNFVKVAKEFVDKLYEIKLSGGQSVITDEKPTALEGSGDFDLSHVIVVSNLGDVRYHESANIVISGIVEIKEVVFKEDN